MSYMTCITSFLDILRFAMSLVTTISSKYLTCLSDSNTRYLREKAFSYVIGLLPILFKQSTTFYRGMVSSSKSKYPSSHTPYTIEFLNLSTDFFCLVQFSSFYHEVLFRFTAGLSFSLITAAVYSSAELSHPDSMWTNTPKPTTILSQTATLICLLRSSRLDFSCCGLNFFRFIPLLFL